MKRQWTEKEINDWYKSFPWLRGSNFLPSNCVNRLDMWQSYKRGEHLAVSDRELKMCKDLGFNTVRLWLNFDVYYKEPETFMDTLEKYISLSDKHNQLVMLVIAYEEDLPYGETFIAKELGEQTVYHNHFNRDYVKENELKAKHAFKHYMQYPQIKPIFLEMVNRVVDKYKHDKRVFCWNIWNEPGITLGDVVIPLMEELFDLVRSYDVDQPLCADIWGGLDMKGKCKHLSEQRASDLSDCISFHSYSPYKWFTEQLTLLKKFYSRPIFMTEWLNRGNHNDVEYVYPLLLLENIACYCWGFVGGGTCTTEPWEPMWEAYENDKDINFDFTKWQHDLYRLNGRPYDPREIDEIKRVNALSEIK